MLAAKKALCSVFEYTPRAMKQAVTGHGNASKEDIQTMVQNMLHLSGRPTVDAADALGLAICHQLHSNPLLKT
ncbi:MAG: crossover junction endodeoxyribonuclease RuvC [Gammaproteobacteria bacterium]|nr:crossover junction endodeoxyribonuclease RuvC [Gammaproteobacteria bacterium]